MDRFFLSVKHIPFFLLISVVISIAQSTGENERINDLFTDSFNNVLRSTEDEFSVKTYWERLPLIKDDFIVNDFDKDVGAKMHNPDIAIDENGNYGIVWIDERNGLKYIYAQFYNINDEKIGKNIKISKRPIYVENRPVIACNPKGDFVVIWLENHSYILAQRLNYNGEKIGDNFNIYSDYYSGIKNISAVLNNDGSFLAAWYNKTFEPNERTGIFSRKFDADGNPTHTDLIINDVDKMPFSVGRNFLAGDYNGNFVITWSADFNNHIRAFLQQLDSSGYKIHNNIMVSDTSSVGGHTNASVAATGDGHFLIVTDEMFKIFYKDGYFTSEQKDFDFSLHTNIIGEMSVDLKNNYFFFLTKELIENNYYVLQIEKNGEYIKSSKLITNEGESIKAQYLSISNIYGNNLYITYTKQDVREPACFIQKYKSDFTPVNNSRKINDDKNNSSSQLDPLVYYNSQGYSIIIWKDRRNGMYELYGQVFDPNNQPIGANILINDVPDSYFYVNNMEICSLSDGTFVVAFIKNRLLYLQKIDISGKKIGNNISLKNGHYYNNYHIKAQVNDNDEILICYYGREYNYNLTKIFLIKLNNGLQPISPLTKIMESKDNIIFSPISVSINKNFDIFVTWANYDIGYGKKYEKIYGLFFTDEGAVNSDTLIINMGRNINYRSIDNRAEDMENFIVAWSGVYGNVYIKRFYNDSLIYKNFYYTGSFSFYPPKIALFKNRKAYITWGFYANVFGCYINDIVKYDRVNTLYRYKLKKHLAYDPDIDNSAAIFNDKLLFAYESNKNGETGFDIWANVQKLEYMDFEEEPVRKPVNDDALYQNYPNPFNRRTKIPFKIYSYHHVKIALYDVLGREVKVLLNKSLDKGFYKIELDASNLPSGLYFCRLQAFNTKVIKMLLVK